MNDPLQQSLTRKIPVKYRQLYCIDISKIQMPRQKFMNNWFCDSCHCSDVVARSVLFSKILHLMEVNCWRSAHRSHRLHTLVSIIITRLSRCYPATYGWNGSTDILMSLWELLKVFCVCTSRLCRVQTLNRWCELKTNLQHSAGHMTNIKKEPISNVR